MRGSDIDPAQPSEYRPIIVNIETEDLRSRMATLSQDELRAVVEAPDDEYSPAAREAARLELANRRPQGQGDDGRPNPNSG